MYCRPTTILTGFVMEKEVAAWAFCYGEDEVMEKGLLPLSLNKYISGVVLSQTFKTLTEFIEKTSRFMISN